MNYFKSRKNSSLVSASVNFIQALDVQCPEPIHYYLIITALPLSLPNQAGITYVGVLRCRVITHTHSEFSAKPTVYRCKFFKYRQDSAFLVEQKAEFIVVRISDTTRDPCKAKCINCQGTDIRKLSEKVSSFLR